MKDLKYFESALKVTQEKSNQILAEKYQFEIMQEISAGSFLHASDYCLSLLDQLSTPPLSNYVDSSFTQEVIRWVAAAKVFKLVLIAANFLREEETRRIEEEERRQFKEKLAHYKKKHGIEEQIAKSSIFKLV